MRAGQHSSFQASGYFTLSKKREYISEIGEERRKEKEREGNKVARASKGCCVFQLGISPFSPSSFRRDAIGSRWSLFLGLFSLLFCTPPLDGFQLLSQRWERKLFFPCSRELTSLSPSACYLKRENVAFVFCFFEKVQTEMGDVGKISECTHEIRNKCFTLLFYLVKAKCLEMFNKACSNFSGSFPST